MYASNYMVKNIILLTKISSLIGVSRLDEITFDEDNSISILINDTFLIYRLCKTLVSYSDSFVTHGNDAVSLMIFRINVLKHLADKLGCTYDNLPYTSRNCIHFYKAESEILYSIAKLLGCNVSKPSSLINDCLVLIEIRHSLLKSIAILLGVRGLV